MKRLLLLTVLIPMLAAAFAQPEVGWAHRFAVETPIFSFGKNLNIVDMDTDEAGALYLLGFHRSDLELDGVPINEPYNGAQTGFLQKLSAEGTPIWYRRLTMGDMRTLAVKAGKVYVGGEIASAEYGPLQIQRDTTGATQTLFAEGYRDAFVARFDTTGVLEWAKAYGGADSESFNKGDRLNALAVDDGGGIYITGSYHRDMDFGGSVVFSEPSDRGKTFYLARLTAEGNLVWAEQIQSPLPIDGGNAEGLGLALSPEGAPVVCIAYSAGGLLLDGEILMNDNQSGDDGCLLVQYDTQGNRLWHRNMEPQEGLIVPFGLETDENGRIYLGFSHEQQVLIEETETLQYFQTEDDLLKTALLCWDENGQLRWGNTLFCSNGAMDVHPDGNVYLSAAAFRQGVALSENTTLSFTPGGSVSFWARFLPDGPLSWAHQPELLEDPPFSTNHNIMVDAQGRAYASANFNQPLTFGNSWTLTTGYDTPDFDALYLIQLDDSNISSTRESALQPLQVFPNPASGLLQATLPEAGQLQLYNMTGQPVWESAHAGGLQAFSLPALPSGIYLLHARTSSGQFLARIAIQQ
ncbi:MAG: T9SS type A sorting domain-containing protein [Phaeodactylibacter sp.]|uniref:T9SS type A sorting domain-containing protein n=1 Tax=Phaeodactylibacter sp. TaxID=1940289 RepID=UPI0032EB991B